MFGDLSYVNEGRLADGIITNYEMVECPIDTGVLNIEYWKEWYDGYWNLNPNIYVKCDGKCIRYPKIK